MTSLEEGDGITFPTDNSTVQVRIILLVNDSSVPVLNTIQTDHVGSTPWFLCARYWECLKKMSKGQRAFIDISGFLGQMGANAAGPAGQIPPNSKLSYEVKIMNVT